MNFTKEAPRSAKDTLGIIALRLVDKVRANIAGQLREYKRIGLSSGLEVGFVLGNQLGAQSAVAIGKPIKRCKRGRNLETR